MRSVRAGRVGVGGCAAGNWRRRASEPFLAVRWLLELGALSQILWLLLIAVSCSLPRSLSFASWPSCPSLTTLACLPCSLLPLLQLSTSFALPPHFADPGQRSRVRLDIDGLVGTLSEPWQYRPLGQWLSGKASFQARGVQGPGGCCSAPAELRTVAPGLA